MKKVYKLLLVAFFFRLILSFVIWHPDVNNHIDWGIRFWEYGPQKFYSANVWSFTWPNQPPGTIYFFAGVRKLFEFIFALFWWINVKIPPFPSGIITFFESNLYPALLKLPSILADVGIAYIIYEIFRQLKKEKLGTFAATIFLTNPVIWYNSSVWGQTDGFVNFFGFLAFYFLLKNKLMQAIFSFATCLYIKASLLIFLPIFLIVAYRQKYKVLDWIKSLLVTTFVIGLVTYPFSKGEPFSWLFQIYKDKVFTQQLQVITANAFNIWAGVAGIHERPQTLLLGPLTYKIWGLILFVVAYIPTLIVVYKKQDVKSIFWALSIAALSSFMLLTNMHERYLYPLFPAFTVLAVLEMSLLPIYWTVAGISLINLYNFWWVPRVQLFIDLLSFGNRLAPRILGFVNFIFFAILYNRFLRETLPLRLFKARKI